MQTGIQPIRTAEHEIQLGNLTISRERYEVKVDEHPVGLTRLEFALLEFLALNRNRIVDMETLSTHLWSRPASLCAPSLRVHVHRLRKKLENVYPWHIKVVQKIGYGLLLDTNITSITASH